MSSLSLAQKRHVGIKATHKHESIAFLQNAGFSMLQIKDHDQFGIDFDILDYHRLEYVMISHKKVFLA